MEAREGIFQHRYDEVGVWRKWWSRWVSGTLGQNRTMSIVPSVAAATAGQKAPRVGSPRGVSTLMYACQQGDVEKVRRLLRAQPEIIAKRDRTGKTALHYCCTSDNICAAQAADLVVMAASDLVEARDEDGFTPLHLAVIAGNLPLVTFLLANNADVNAVDSEKHTVVHWATVCGETGALRAVLAAGAPVSTPDVHGGYPLHYAAQMCGGEKDSSLGLQVLQALLQHPEIKVTVEDGDGRQPLLWAASAGSAKAVLALIRAGSTVNAPDKDGLTALHCAASRGHTDCIDTLLTLCGMSADVIDSNGCTALHYSVTLGHADATALLLTHGADPNRQDRRGRSPAHCGCAKGQFETMKLIGAHGANLWLRNARGDLPLHEAAASGRRDLVKWLLEARPSQVNARNNDGRCPLHLAALNDNSDMCKILLDAGAQINPVLRTSKNAFMTPLDCALQRGFRSTAKYLQLHGGVPANRLSSSKINLPNGGINVHIKEDITWGDTSDSERENGDKDERVKKKHRKKLTYRYERKKNTSDDKNKDRDSSGDKEGAKRREKSATRRKGSAEEIRKSGEKVADKTKDNVTYSSEVKITNNYGGINIERNGEIIISDGTPIMKATDTTIVKQEDKLVLSETPKETSTAKMTEQAEKTEKIQDPTSIPRSDTNNNNTLTANVKQTERSKSDLGENIEEIKSLASTIEKSAKHITQEVIHMQENLRDDTIKQPDQYSNTSADESEHKELIVEAAIHVPPKAEPPVEVKDNVIKAQADEMITSEIRQIQQTQSVSPDDSSHFVTQIASEIGAAKEDTTIKEIPIEKSEITEPQPDFDDGSMDESSPSKNKISQGEDILVSMVGDEEGTLRDEYKDEDISVIKPILEDESLMPLDINQDKLDVETEPVKEAEEEHQDTQENVVVKEQPENIDATPITPKEEVSDISLDTPDTVKLASQPTFEEQKSDQDQKIESITEEPLDINEVIDQLEELPEDKHEPTEELGDVETTATEEAKTNIPPAEPQKEQKTDTVGTEGVTSVNVESKGKAITHKRKFLKEKKSSIEEVSPNGKTVSPSEKGTKRVDSVRDKRGKSIKKDRVKVEEKTKDSDKLKKTLTTKNIDQQRERSKDRPPTKAIEKILEVSDGTKEMKVKRRRKDYEETKPKERKSRKETRGGEESSEDDSSDIERKTKHKSFTILDDDEGTRRSRISKSKSPAGQTEERLKRSKIPTPVFNLRKDISKSDRHIDNMQDIDTRIALPNLSDELKYNNLRPSAYSDNDRSGSDGEDVSRGAARRRRLRKRMKRDSRSAGSDYESSNLIDSGFEPSPRSSRIPKWKNMTERGVNMTSVTQTIQTNIRRYHLERKIFQHLLELKRHQIRSGQHNEAVLVKRAIDEYHNSCASTVGAGRYIPEDYTFKSFEHFLYHSLRKLQKNGVEHLRGLPETPDNPLLCTRSTHRCHHATHAYTGIPCAAYLPMMDHHTIPKIGFTSKPQRFLPHINPKKTVTLELCHGNDKQVISLPTDRLDQNKRYYVTFTVKGQEPTSPNDDVPTRDDAHRHAKSV